MMKRTLMAILAALLLALPVLCAAEAAAVDVQGFWYSEEADDGIELANGSAIISDVDGVTIAEGSYEADGANVTIVAGDRTYACTVSGNTMTVDAGSGAKRYTRDGIEENYWTSTTDDSAIELYGGRAWQYDEAGDLVGEGSYEIEGDSLTIIIGDKTMTGTVSGNTLTIDGLIYTWL